MLIDCPDPHELTDYLDGRLDALRSSVVSAHLKSCSACLESVDSIHHDQQVGLKEIRLLCAEMGDDPVSSYADEAHCHAALQAIRTIPMGNSDTGAAASTESRIGLKIRDLKIISMLGQGGMGTVYKALHTRLGRIVALKVLPTDRSSDRSANKRFQREMRAVGRLSHPNIVVAHDAGEVDDTPFLVMELVRGVDLSKLVRAHGPLDVSDACQIVYQAASGLDHIHSHKLVHRDIKPSNLMLDSAKVVKILDLGLALLHKPIADDSSQETLGPIMGTLDYMAPEQVSDSDSVDVRADIYSLGATFYRLLCGKTALSHINGKSQQDRDEKMAAILRGDLTPIASQEANLPEPVRDLVTAMLATRPEDRPQSPQQVMSAIETLFAENILPTADLGRYIRYVPEEIHPTADELSMLSELRTDLSGMPPEEGVSTVRSQVTSVHDKQLNGNEPKKDVQAKAGRKPKNSAANRTVLGLIFAALLIGSAIPFLVPDSDELPDGPGTVIRPTQVSHHNRAISDGALIGAPSAIAGLKTWTAETVAPRGEISDVKYAPDERLFVVASKADPVLRVFDTANRNLVHAFIGQDEGILSVGWNREGTHLASVGSEGTLQIWDLDTGRKQLTRTAESSSYRSVEWSPVSGRLCLGDDAGSVRIWGTDWRSKDPAVTLQAAGVIVDEIQWAPDEQQLAIGSSAAGKFRVYNFPSGDPIKFETNLDLIYAVVFSPNGENIGMLHRHTHDVVRILNRKTLAVIHEDAPVRKGTFKSLSWDKLGSFLSAAHYRGVTNWSAETGWQKDVMEADGNVRVVDWRSDGDRVLAGCVSGTILVLDTKPAKQHETIKGYALSTQPIAWSPTRDIAAIVHKEISQVYYLNPKTGEVSSRNDLASNYLRGVAWLPSQEEFLTVGKSADGAICIEVLSDEKTVQTIPAPIPNFDIAKVRSSPSRSQLAILGRHGHISTGEFAMLVVDLDRELGARIETLLFPYEVKDAEFSPDGKLLAVSCRSGLVQLFHSDSLELYRTLPDQNDEVSQVSWAPSTSPDSSSQTILATVTGDVHLANSKSVVTLWSAPEMAVIANVNFSDAVTGIGWSATHDRFLLTTLGRQLSALSLEGNQEILADNVKPAEYFVGDDNLCVRVDPSRVDIMNAVDGSIVCSLIHMARDFWIAAGRDGKLHPSPGMESNLIYITENEDLTQKMYNASEFAQVRKEADMASARLADRDVGRPSGTQSK